MAEDLSHSDSRLAEAIRQCGSTLRALKAQPNPSEDEVQAKVRELLAAKAHYFDATGTPWPDTSKSTGKKTKKVQAAKPGCSIGNQAGLARAARNPRFQLHQLSAVNETAIEALMTKGAVSAALSTDDKWMRVMLSSFPRTARTPTQLIQRLSYTRSSIVEAAVKKWGSSYPSSKQIVQIGAGLDPLVLKLIEEDDKLVGIEIDETPVLAAKATALCSSPEGVKLLGALHPTQEAEPSRWLWDRLRFAVADLAVPGSLRSALESCGFDPSLPTLFVSEVVISYLPQPRHLLAEAAALSQQGPASFVLFEPLRGHGAFGQALSKGFRERSCPLAAHDDCGEPFGMEELAGLVGGAGWGVTECLDANDAAEAWLSGGA